MAVSHLISREETAGGRQQTRSPLFITASFKGFGGQMDLAAHSHGSVSFFTPGTCA